MEDVRGTVITVGGSVAAIVLQIVLAPSIAIGNGMPNFIMMFALAIAIARPDHVSPVLPFVLGLMYDFLGSGPVGAQAFLLVLVSYAMTKAFQVLDNDNPVMPFIAMALAALAVEVLYGAFMLGAGVEASIIDALVYRALPCTLYDIVAGAVLYLIVSRLLSGGGAHGSRAKFGQPRF